MTRAWLVVNGWGGATKTEVEVIGWTPQRVRIRALTNTRLAGRARWLDVGATALVPFTAVGLVPIRPERSAL